MGKGNPYHDSKGRFSSSNGMKDWENDYGTIDPADYDTAQEYRRDLQAEEQLKSAATDEFARAHYWLHIPGTVIKRDPGNEALRGSRQIVDRVYANLDERCKNATFEEIKEFEAYGYCESIYESCAIEPREEYNIIYKYYDICYAQIRKREFILRMNKLDLFKYADFESRCDQSPFARTAYHRLCMEGWREDYEKWQKDIAKTREGYERRN